MFVGDQLGLANSDIIGQGILEIGQGKVSEKSGNFTFYSLWEPCALKSTGILLVSVELSTVDRVLNKCKIVVPLFGAAYAAPSKGTMILYQFSSTNFSIISV